MAKAAWISVDGGRSEMAPMLCGEVGEGAEPDTDDRALRCGDRGEDGPLPEDAEVIEVVISPLSGGPAVVTDSSSISNLFSGTGGAGS